MKNSYLTVTDQFCGAGGSSQGVRMVANEKGWGNGLQVKLAMNHWPLAIESHNSNFPQTEHVCTDISACDPRRYYSTDILITSPECTVHSPAGGGQAKKKKFGNQMDISGRLASDIAEERSRATMWDVCRFAEYHQYNIIIVENVIEARKWVLFDGWLTCLDRLGYDHEIKYINSMHAHPTPQSRDRMYCVFWRKGNRKPDLNFTPLAPCNKCLKNVEAYQWFKPKKKNAAIAGDYGKYRTQYLYKCPDCHEVVEPYFYAAFNCIDWTKPGTRIGDRKKRLSPKTEERCQFGIDTFWDEPSIINVRYDGVERRVRPAAGEPMSAQTSQLETGLLSPVIISSRYISGIGSRVKDSKVALPVQVTEGRESVLFPPLLSSRQMGNDTMRIKDSTDNPLPTQLADECHSVVNPPLVIDAGWSADKPRVDVATEDPLATQDTGQTKGLVLPFLIKNYSGEHHNTLSAENALGAVTAADHHGVMRAPLIVENLGTSKSRPAIDRLPAVTTERKHGIITADSFNSFLAYYNRTPQVSHITKEMKVITGSERLSLIQQPYQKPKLQDCFYRMLLPHEIQLGMAFDPDYIVLGDSKQKVKQLGNAVTPPVMKFLVERCVESLQ